MTEVHYPMCVLARNKDYQWGHFFVVAFGYATQIEVRLK